VDVQERIRQHLESQPVVIFTKGSPEQPMCGFSARTAEAIKQCRRPFAWVNVLAEPDIRQALPAWSDWPTFPQVYIDGELIGGCDLTLQLAEQGELRRMIDQATDPPTS
jgi:monothiol glutaredoxin